MNEIKKFIQEISTLMRNPIISILPGELAFFFLWSIIPLVILFGELSGIFDISLDIVGNYIQAFTPEQFTNMVSPYLESGQSGLSFSTIASIVVPLWLASKAIASVIRAANVIYEVNSESNFVLLKLKAIILTLIMMLIIIFLLIIPIFGQYIINFLLSIFDYNFRFPEIAKLIQWLFSVFVIFVGISFIYTFCPDKKLYFNDTFIGSIITTTGWIGASFLFSIYIQYNQSYDIIYGSLANIIALMFWFYILFYIFVFGMTINASCNDIISKN